MVLLRSTAVAVMSSVALSGCVTGNSLQSQYGNSDGKDRCIAYREPLIQTEDEFNEPIIQGAVIGALVGTAAGALTTGDARGAAIGGVTGALAGGAMGYYNARQKQARNQEELVAAIEADARGDQTKFGRIGNTVNALGQCRQRQVADVRERLTAGKIDKTQAKNELADIEKAAFFDNELIGKVAGSMQSRVDTYAKARSQATNESLDSVLASAEAEPPAPAIQLAEVQTAATVRATPSTNGKRLGSLSASKMVEVQDTTSDGKWTRIKYQDADAYIATSSLQKSQVVATAKPAKPAKPTTAVQSLAKAKSDVVAASNKANENVQNDIAATRALL